MIEENIQDVKPKLITKVTELSVREANRKCRIIVMHLLQKAINILSHTTGMVNRWIMNIKVQKMFVT